MKRRICSSNILEENNRIRYELNQLILGTHFENYKWFGRLEKMFGSLEAIERALFSKLVSFPKISGKDQLAELEATKLDGYLPGLSYRDTTLGVSQIVGKHSYTIQENGYCMVRSTRKSILWPSHHYMCLLT